MIIKGKEYAYRMNGRIYHCAMDVTMSFIGGKWKTVVLWYLRNDAKRFSELKRLIPEITEKMLSVQLKQLEQDAIVERTVYPQVPPKVEYRLTKTGKTLLPILEEIASWGLKRAETEAKKIEVPSRTKIKKQHKS
ncbi:MAG: helix-turn-helix domain-containing protein [Bacteroidota bacterium]|nr:helix-turn-helix domain-containing protein [Bacteroidota bacterium]